MKFAGIIAEYDPFHNGHAWQLAQARALGAQRVAVAMSCGLTQRGALPLLPESVRVRAALECGADLVFALPAPTTWIYTAPKKPISKASATTPRLSSRAAP